MLETIQEYATEQLDAQPEFAAAAREHHARYFVELARRVAGGRRPEATAERSVALEIDNLRHRLAPLRWRSATSTRLNALARRALADLRGARLVSRDASSSSATCSASWRRRRTSPIAGRRS